ncbi:response regulator [Chitinimonas viridis]|uniref:Response regulator n=1 Tax=Chitinimonas viridis TaxID=664880 RepID=A0ABT8B4R2_9NEIS|nr:response regulator [Chitinimonas viridis]MDN3576538.1 response regulator [Chitinimonas viridis]
MSNEQIILLVEDSDADAELTAMAFQEARIGNPILRMRNGLAALDYLFAQGAHAGRDVTDIPAVVLLDLNLPLMSGLEVLRAIRGDTRIRHLPVIVLTSSNEDKDRLEAYDHFANSYVQKPVDYDQFVQASRQLGLYWLVLNRPAPRRDV